ncbi:MAG: gephyrin-like molybdotransferase Glp [Acidimicrobiia bacterium]
MNIAFAEALRFIETRCRCTVGETPVALQDADGRILAADVAAPISVPPADNSAVDGYAFRHADLERAAFSVVGVAAAGRPFPGAVGEGQAVRILTGGLPPAGCDAIVMQEDVAVAGDRLTIPGAVPLHANIRRAGEDIRAGSVVLAAGRRLGPSEIGVLASLGLSTVAVRAPLRVAVFSSGDELVQPGDTLRPGAVFDANRPMLLSVLTHLGMTVSDRGVLPDGVDAIGAALAEAARGHDAIVSSAGVSVGDEDHVRAAVLGLGALDFEGVAIKPGSPMTAGHVAGIPFFGLPGNPVAMMVTFLMLARPGLLALAGARGEPPQRIPVAAGFSARSRPGRREYLRAVLRAEDDKLVAVPCSRGGSGVLTSMIECDGLIELEEAVAEVVEGAPVPFIPLAALGL